MKFFLILLVYTLTVQNIVKSQERNQFKEIYNSILNDPFNIYDEILEVQKLEKRASLSQTETNWAILVLSALVKFSGYKYGYFINSKAFNLGLVGKSDTILQSYSKEDDSYPAYIFEITHNNILLRKNKSTKYNYKYSKNNIIMLAAGLKYQSEKRYKKAIKKLKSVSENADVSWAKWWANRYLSVIYRKLGNVSKEEYYLKMNLKNNPEYPYFYEHLGSFYYRQERYNDALEIVKKGAKNGSYPNLSRLRGKIYAKILLKEDRP